MRTKINNFSLIRGIFFSFLLIAAFCVADPSATVPEQVVLTWQHAPQTTMTITWQTAQRLEQPQVLYGPDQHPQESCKALGVSEAFDNTRVETPRVFWLNTVELTGLEPATEYRVTIPHETCPEQFTFRTAPETAEKIEFIAFSDVHFATPEEFEQCKDLFEKIAAENPDFCLGTGDFWFVEGEHDVVDLWFEAWHEIMKTPNGRRIPIIPAEGNHDRKVAQNDAQRIPAESPFFYQRFKLPQPRTHYVTQYGPHLTIITLNSNHSAPIAGDQTQWLEQTLKAHQHSRWLIVQHHVAPYPAYKEIAYREQAIRRHWVPLYEKYGVDLVISGHDHTYSQTHPLKNNKIDQENGIVYLVTNGIGGPREPDRQRGYLKETDRKLVFWRLTLTEENDRSTLRAVPVFPYDPDVSAQPVVLTKDAASILAYGRGIGCRPAGVVKH